MPENMRILGNDPALDRSMAEGLPRLVGIDDVIERVEKYTSAGKFCLLVGKRGSGKTTAAQAVAVRLSRPFETILCSECEANEWLAKPELNDGTLSRAAGALTQLVSKPGVVLLDEFHLLSERSQSHLVSLTDHRRAVYSSRLDAGLQVQLHPEFSLIAATTPQGLRRVSPDLVSRAFLINVSRPNSDQFADILAMHVPSATATDIDTVTSVFRAIVDSGIESDFEFTREMIKLTEAMSMGIGFVTAVEDSLLNGLPPSVSSRVKDFLATQGLMGELKVESKPIRPRKVS